jgi:putative inorganic carbon (HCO3(-)) transporter
MFKDNWLLGIGVGNKNFREIYGLYMKTGFDALSAYNIYLETAVESGIFALIAFLAFLIKLICDGTKYIFTSKNTANIIFAGASLIAVCSALFHGLVDTIYFRPQLQFIFWTFVAVINTVLSSKEEV